MENFASLAKEFYENEKDFLLANYPGLTIHRLKRELEEYYHGFLDQKEFLESPCLGGESSPYKAFTDKLREGIPLEYIQGHCYFYKSRYVVTPDVLIPRNETESLVEMSVNYLNKQSHKKNLQFIDCGTGSGVIALAILDDCDFPIKAIATDIDPKAIEVAKRNYYLHQFSINPASTCKFQAGDRLEGIEGSYDLIVSNPPYIKATSDLSGVHPQTQKFEPHLALFIEDADYEGWFRVFFNQALGLLVSRGVVLMEGHENHLLDLKSLALECGFKEAHVLRDLVGNERFLHLIKE